MGFKKQSYMLWNPGLAYKFLSGGSLEVESQKEPMMESHECTYGHGSKVSSIHAYGPYQRMHSTQEKKGLWSSWHW